MGEFSQIAKQIAGHLSELADSRKIDTNELAEITRAAAEREEINLYPGVPGYGCYGLSIFVSLSSPSYVKGKHGHLSCGQAIEKVVQHMQGACMNRTRTAVLVTDSWDSYAWDEWKVNLQQIENTAHFEIYLITGRNVSEIQI
ncbi:MAG: hypothetical protein ACQESJ_10765 [Bacteroidota bacterium]|jgi:hypothetical protein